jgi:hypothetical protein
MNRLLAETVGVLNGLLAIVLIIIGMVVGAASTDFQRIGIAGALLGGVIGFAVALFSCGLLALFIEMRSELIRIRTAVERAR